MASGASTNTDMQKTYPPAYENPGYDGNQTRSTSPPVCVNPNPMPSGFQSPMRAGTPVQQVVQPAQPVSAFYPVAGQQVAYQQPVTFTNIPPPQPFKTRPKFARDSQRRCGILQVVFGCMAIIIGIVAINVEAGYFVSPYTISFAVCAGVFMIIAGSLGIVSERSCKTSHIVACMVMSILASLCACCFTITSIAALSYDVVLPYYGFSWYRRDEPLRAASLSVDVMGIMIGLAGCVVAIIQSAVCCRTACCGKTREQTTVHYSAQRPVQVQQFVQPVGMPAVQPHVYVYQNNPAAGAAMANAYQSQPQPTQTQIHPAY